MFPSMSECGSSVMLSFALEKVKTAANARTRYSQNVDVAACL